MNIYSIKRRKDTDYFRIFIHLNKKIRFFKKIIIFASLFNIFTL